MKILDEIKKRLQVWHEQRAASIEYKRQTQLDAEAREAVQVMEFNSRLYICVHGTPLFDIDIFKNSVAEVVACGRSAYKDWKEEKLWERNGTTHVSTVC
ncbi:hypothetical protein PI172_0662 [Prevotella intermedia]|uniref:Uncharacterized protein n=1 Tax=Prevotella intermedia TaxID=28131 RepID=A0AAD1F6N9_PREIN|nr:hypothetical protein [Prevotella intermedia]AFJ08086.1 hypothetical protein PIN17_A0015 [Prevotella intermedia 17]APW34864.1 hypothetical protein BWX40_08520 [Prevotella intermedia]BAR95390.1 hypothetical protein PI172_0662 [Prevotella intermedia]